ncbi:hypothetical protein NQ317_016946 [Molorchus minor]|uniref:Uncharacterized protein n=1 Tax=Molorchus minor TaxID=1323400 RepID=A0ABQ9K3X4_9CUCU|nr:hypothetical protein NQ317_016946 [Molorchus minor]
MSGQHNQSTPARIQKSSPNLAKQGPMKATIPMSSVLKQSSNLKSGNNSNSPAVSPTYYWKSRTSPDHSSGQRSPGSSAYKSKSKTFGSCSSDVISMRRTASLDTIYLKGHWPRENLFWHWHTGTLQIDKATQTDELDWSDSWKVHSISETDDKLDKHIRQKIRACILPLTFKANPVGMPLKPLPKSSIRNSVEGLNQEIERIVLKTGCESHSSRCDDNDKLYQITPEGHRAPLAELFRCTKSRIDHQPDRRMALLISYFAGDSQGSSPDHEAKLGTSPQINKFLAREPPDGCEKVHLKLVDDRKYVTLEHPGPPSTFKLKPSLGSAFQLLQPNVSNTVDQDLPIVPPRQDLN